MSRSIDVGYATPIIGPDGRLETIHLSTSAVDVDVDNFLIVILLILLGFVIAVWIALIRCGDRDAQDDNGALHHRPLLRIIDDGD